MIFEWGQYFTFEGIDCKVPMVDKSLRLTPKDSPFCLSMGGICEYDDISSLPWWCYITWEKEDAHPLKEEYSGWWQKGKSERFSVKEGFIASLKMKGLYNKNVCCF